MIHSLEVQPTGPLRAKVRPPGSKSITNRALVCAALADGPSVLHGVLASEDTQVMIESLGRLGVSVTHDPGRHTCHVIGHGPPRVESAGLFVANSGTTIRFLTAMAALGTGHFRLDGIERMRERPIADLLAALEQLGVVAATERGNGCPPLAIKAHGLPGGSAHIRGDISSQFLSALLMVAPYAENEVDVHVEGELVSKPYVEMTLAVMQSFGVSVAPGGLQHFHIPGRQRYRACEYDIEPDASAASYFWGAAAVTGGEITVQGLSQNALQGDVRFCECLEKMGCKVRYETDAITVSGGPLAGVDVNMNAISDTVQTLAVVALFAESPTRIRGVGHIRHKETDRIGDLARELRRLGAIVTEHDDGLTITPGELQPAEIQTYNDHRMAMSLALAGLRMPGVVIHDPGCVAKTYPNFFEDLAALSHDAAS